jgi:hypothetical protein
MLKKLATLADHLDKVGKLEEANYVDALMQKIAGTQLDLDFSGNILREDIVPDKITGYVRFYESKGEPYMIEDDSGDFMVKRDSSPLILKLKNYYLGMEVEEYGKVFRVTKLGSKDGSDWGHAIMVKEEGV